MTNSILSSVWTHLSEAVIERGEGIYLYDKTGKQYIDFTSGIGVTNTGHCHPNVVDAIQKQSEKLLFGQINCVIPDATVNFADTIASVLPENLNSVFFSNSGAEAVEGAIKLAKVATGRTNIISFQGSFHGRTAMTMALTGSKTVYRSGFQPLPSGVFFAPFPYAYRYGWDEDTTVDFCLNELDLLLKSQSSPQETAAIIIEPVMGEGGYVSAPASFLKALRQICDDNGILLIFDEVQCGCGRTGKFWAYNHSNVQPDILVAAKGIASGMPLSMIASSQELMNKFDSGSHGGTYGGGNAIVMAAAQATVSTIIEENLAENAEAVGNYLIQKLCELQRDYPQIGDVRGKGMMVATEFSQDGQPATDIAKNISKYCEKEGLLLLTCGSYSNVIRWIPPLITTRAQIDSALAIFEKVLKMLQIINPYDESIVSEVQEHTASEVKAIIGKAANAFEDFKSMPAIRRANVLLKASELLFGQAEEVASIIVQESGKPIRYAKGEVNRASETLMFAADEARQLHGETIPMSAAKGGIGKFGYFVREPVGVVGAITPFNFPLNLVAHKVAPAIAVGCSIVLKPNPLTPLTALKLQEILHQAGLPQGVFEIVLGDVDVGEVLTTDDRISMISFTGSPAVASHISKVVGLRRATYELGGNAATIIHSDADIDRAVDRCVMGSFAYSGQVCISVQRIYVHRDIYDIFKKKFTERTARLRIGDPKNEDTDIGPMISLHAAERVEAWLDEALGAGSTAITGGKRKEKIVYPTILENIDKSMKVVSEEIFGPVVCLQEYNDFDQAIFDADDSQFGLQIGVFTQDISRIMDAIKNTNVGGVIINDVPTFRVDQMPYGGNKNSGVGREGPRFAIEEMTTIKTVVINW